MENLKIKATSPKRAYLLTDGTIEFWVKPNCVRADGSFTPSVYKEYEKRLKWHQETVAFEKKIGGTPKLWQNPANPTSFRIYVGEKYLSLSCWVSGNVVEGRTVNIKVHDDGGYERATLIELLRNCQFGLAAKVTKSSPIGCEYILQIPDGNGGYITVLA